MKNWFQLFYYFRIIKFWVFRLSFGFVKLAKKFIKKTPYLFFIISCTLSILILFSSFLLKVPVFENYAKVFKVLTKYEQGESVKIYDDSLQSINKNVEVFVDGYHTKISDDITGCILMLSSQFTDEFYVVIKYSVGNEIKGF